MSFKVKKFTFNPFQENTYVLYGQDKNAVIIDPGCSTSSEKQVLSQFIAQEDLDVVALLNTHCHIDHVFGNEYVISKYKVDFYMHRLDLPVLASAERVAMSYGIDGYIASPLPTKFIEDGDVLKFGDITLTVIFGPGHSPGHVAFYDKDSHRIISGDILFKGSFGRVDLPGGDLETLKTTIHSRIFTLPENTIVFSGHGEETTIGEEKINNYILQY